MRNIKKRRKGEEGLAAQPLGPASPVRARRPSKQAQATATARAPSPASCRCHLGPARQPRAVHPHAPLPFAVVAASGPRPSAIPCSSSPRRAQPSADRRPTASAEWARGSCPSHGLAPPWRSAHANAMPTTHAPQAARCAQRDPQPSAVELGAPAIRAPALEP